MMHLNRDFLDFISLCTARDVKFLIVGGYALAAHGHPRYTKDLDVWILVDDNNAGRLMAALDDFGFGALPLTKDDFTESDIVVQLGYDPARIDILTSASGLSFEESYGRRVEVEVDGVMVPFVGLDDLRANKRATGRLRDLADIEDLDG
jgi:hypothetical protein